MTKQYVSPADTAKLIRKALAAHWPATKFYVRTKTYSGGASVDVSWIDGPSRKAVEVVANRFEGATFDGMIDLKEYQEGTHPDTGQAVHFQADFVFCNRHYSPEFVRRLGNRIAVRYGCEMPEIIVSQLWRAGKPTDTQTASFTNDYSVQVCGQPRGDFFNRELWNAE